MKYGVILVIKYCGDKFWRCGCNYASRAVVGHRVVQGMKKKIMEMLKESR